MSILAKTVDRIILFTLSACPMGRSMGTVLKEVSELYPTITMETVFVDQDIERTNTFRVKTNPTTLFLSKEEEVIARFEGFHETAILNKKIESIEQGEPGEKDTLEENHEVVEVYTIYLYKREKAMPVEIEYVNQTSVKAPRITAIKVLLDTQRNGFINPFPSDAELTLVQFDKERGKIFVSMDELPTQEAYTRMHELVEKTLSHYGVSSIDLIINK